MIFCIIQQRFQVSGQYLQRLCVKFYSKLIENNANKAIKNEIVKLKYTIEYRRLRSKIYRYPTHKNQQCYVELTNNRTYRLIQLTNNILNNFIRFLQFLKTFYIHLFNTNIQILTMKSDFYQWWFFKCFTMITHLHISS